MSPKIGIPTQFVDGKIVVTENSAPRSIHFPEQLHFSLIASLTDDGKISAVIVNAQDYQVAEIRQPVETVEDAYALALAFVDEHPELFDGTLLVDTAEQSQQKNPEQFDDGGLNTVPGN